jgi:hypothetical protein
MNTGIISQVSQAMQTVLTDIADELARTSNFIKRQVKVTGSNFCQTLVMGWLGKPEATLEELCQTAAAIELEITPQGLEQRFTEEAANFMKAELEDAMAQVVHAEPVTIPILQRFKGVYLTDSSTVSLPNELSKVWIGCGNGKGKGKAALKLETRLDMLQGEMDGPLLTDGRTNDRKAARQHKPLPKGSLSIADLGYWKLADLEEKSLNGVYWLSRPQVQTVIYDEWGKRWTLADLMGRQTDDQIDMVILLGATYQIPARLVAVRAPQEVADQRRYKLKKQAHDKGKTVSQARLALAGWTLFVTNVPEDKLSVKEVLVLGRMRWQIELIFKLWKSHGQIDKSRSQKPWRILCEVYAKLIAMIIQHWTFLLGNWSFPDRSLVKAAKTVRQHALNLAVALSDLPRLEQALTILSRCLTVGCRINKSVKTPRTFQLLLALDEGIS